VQAAVLHRRGARDRTGWVRWVAAEEGRWGDREHACVIRVVIFGRQAESSARHLGQGSVVFIAGHLRQREIVTGEGEERRMLEVICERIVFLSEPVAHAREIARAFIDPPAMVPDANARPVARERSACAPMASRQR